MAKKGTLMTARSFIRLAGSLALCLLSVRGTTLSGQAVSPPQQHESVVVNIEVPVRVLRKNVFVDGLTLADFEVYENGVRQPLEAVYLIKDKRVLREEKAPGASPPSPGKARNYVLYLDLKEYIPKVGDALDYFFSDVLGAEDSLFVVTPVKTYKFRSEYLARVSRREVSDKLKAILRKDIQLGETQYRRLMRDFYRLEEEEFPAELADVKETMLFDLATQMRDLTEITESRVMAFADTLKSLDGEKHVFLVFQKDVLPGHEFAEDKQIELIKPVSFDVEKIKRHFSDASITVHCLYITKTPSFAVKPMTQSGSIRESRLQDLSTDIYASFREMAAATGGLSESTTNPSFAIRQAAEASSNYYLVYYRPVDYRADGRFQKIEIRVKGEGLKVTHRLGYVAD
jgi:VWFA-related protein